MKLLVLAPQPFFQHRGTPIATLKMLNVLSQDGHEIDLLTYHEGSPIDIPNCRHLRIPSIPLVHNVPPGFSIRKLICDVFMTFRVLSLSLRKEYDLIHAVEESVFMAMLVKLITGIPYIYDMDSSLPRQITDQIPLLRIATPLFQAFERQAVRRSRGVVAVCQSLEEVAASHSNDVPIVRIEDASLITEDPREPDEALALEGSVLMYVGNLQSYQGIDLLLAAFTHVYHQHRDAQLVIIGGTESEIQRYRGVAQQFAIDDRTHFLGQRPLELLGDYLSQADVLISPRRLGSNTPMKIYSYLASGTPVLATALPMHSQILDTDVACLVEDSPLEMARGICFLLENEQVRKDLAQAAKQRVSLHYDARVLDSKLSEFYQELALALGCD